MDCDVLIVGAGLSGLVAAREVLEAGHSVILLDKGRSVGGRMATRRIQQGAADTGAQFFTVRTNTFQNQIERWLERDLIHVWSYGWSDGSLKRPAGDGHPRYVAKQGMNHLMKQLAEDIPDVRVNVTIESAAMSDTGWTLRDSDGTSYSSRALILTPPVPQSLNLLDTVGLTLDEREALTRIEYAPCLAGLFVIEGDFNLPEPGALQDFDRIVYWIADNQRKGVSPDERIITAHADENYSKAHYDDPDAENLAFLRGAVQNFLGADARITEEQLKKWRYSKPLTLYPHDCMAAENLALVFAGDAFGGRGRVEGAYLSGLAAGKAAIDKLE